jgi:hypothetical protein
MACSAAVSSAASAEVADQMEAATESDEQNGQKAETPHDDSPEARYWSTTILRVVAAEPDKPGQRRIGRVRRRRTGRCAPYKAAGRPCRLEK